MFRAQNRAYNDNHPFLKGTTMTVIVRYIDSVPFYEIVKKPSSKK